MKVDILNQETKQILYSIEFKSPTEEDLSGIDGPDMEGQTSAMDVYVDRKLDELRNILENGYTFRCNYNA